MLKPDPELIAASPKQGKSQLLTLLFGGLCVVSFLVMIETRQYYTNHMPRHPIEAQGVSIPVRANYDVVVYVNQTQNNIWLGAHIFPPASAICVLLTVFLGGRRDGKLRRMPTG